MPRSCIGSRGCASAVQRPGLSDMLRALAPAVLVALVACGGGGGGGPGNDPDVVVTISPATATASAGQTVQFSATVTGSSNTKVNWSASGGTISGDGLYTAPMTGGGYTVRATADANPKDSATGLVTVTGADSVVEPFYDSSHPYVQLMTPMPFATYFAPATIRMWAHAPDTGNDNVKSFSPRVDFFLGTTMVGSVALTNNDPVDYYEVDAKNVPAGSYELFVRSNLASGAVESIHVPVTVVEPSGTGEKRDLTTNVVLSGSTNYDLIGTPTARATLSSSNGSRIVSMPGWTGHLTIRNADIIGLGNLDNPAMEVPGIQVTVSGSNTLEISDSVFDRVGAPVLGAADHAVIAFRGNTLAPNMLTPVNDQPDYGGSHPSLTFTGGSDAPKTFQGNNVGVSFVRFDHSSHWTVGGDTDADGNVLIGVRGGLEFDFATDITIRGNYSYHRYPFGWSQGHNLDFEGNATGGDAKVLVEHNVFRSSSWMIQSLPEMAKFQYNLLVDNINEAFFRDIPASASVHHNVLVNSGFQRLFLPSGGVLIAAGSFDNNTVDVGGMRLGWVAAPFMPFDGTHHLASVRNNVLTGFAYQNQTDLIAAGAASAADHNCVFNPDTTKLRAYADGGLGSSDVTADPHFAQPRVIPFPISDGDVWRRRVTVSQVLALYRAIYTPAAGSSPLIGAGANGLNIGAIGAGLVDPSDKFGKFGM
jgi:hypothetical protein